MNLHSRVLSTPLFSILVITSLANGITKAQTNIQQPQNGQRLVKLSVLVTDASKRPVSNVKQEEFRVLEDGVPQTISFFSKEEIPLLYGIAIDNSGSFRSVLEPVIKAARSIVNQNTPNDEALLIRFIDRDRIEIVRDFTSDKAALSSALDTLHIEGGQTAVIDAVYLTAQRLSQYKKDDGVNRRRAIILITDGEDRSSHYKKDQLIDLLRKQDIQVFVIGMVNVLENEGRFPVPSSREQSIQLINSLAKETGGIAFFPKSPKELQNIASEFRPYLQTQYVIGYSPTGKESHKPYRKVSVNLLDSPERKKHTVTTRSGYVTSINR